jgi:hypothetical protein
MTSLRPESCLADCPFPPELRVDLESAETEWMKSRQPADVPGLVFSTRALEHGRNASGAAGLRKGFAWNDQMDLAWALGYPAMTFLVDGAPDSKEAILAFFGKTPEQAASHVWFSQFFGSRNLVPRRAAFALLHEIEHRENPFKLSDEDFRKATEPRELSDDKVRMLLKTTPAHNLDKVAFLLEALAGSALPAETLCEVLAERASSDGDNGKFRTSANNSLMAILRRLPSPAVVALLERGAPDARKRGLESLAKGSSLALTRLQWVDDAEVEMLQAFQAEAAEGVGDIPFPRYLYAGGQQLIEAQVKLFDKYMDGPVKFFKEYSTVRHPLLTGPALLARAHKDYREGMTLWFERHADYFRPLLAELINNPKLKKSASDVLKHLG